jgi:GWxTD domain-containing protein
MIDTLNPKKKQRVRTLSSMLLPLVIISFALLFLSSSCRLYKLEQKLDPDNAEFLSRVRYIITSKERKIFLELPDAEKEDFKKEFWKRRDPDPSTEENEFKMEYFNRMEASDNLFVSEGKPGWLTDRGRIYILFGPPLDRITYPMGEDAYGRCREIWYYGNFPVVFIDSTCSGDYRLVTYDLSSIRSLNLMYMHELSMAQASAQDTIRGEKKFFDFDLDVKKTLDEENRLEGIVAIDIPYADLWFKAEEEMLSTVLDLKLELRDAEGNLIWEYEDSLDIKISEQELKESMIKEYNIEIPFALDKDVDKLRKGKNKLFALIKNRTGGEELRKIREFTF